MTKIVIDLEPVGRRTEIEHGQTILEAAQAAAQRRDAPGVFAAPLRCRPGATRLISASSPLRPGTIALQTPELC